MLSQRNGIIQPRNLQNGNIKMNSMTQKEAAMAETERQQMGDGSDSFGQTAGQLMKAAGRAGREAAKQATADVAAATVKAGMESGKAVAEVAAGTAAGGPWGAVLSAAWSMRNSLFKVLICICMALLIIITLVVSLPSVVTDSILGLNGTKPAEGATLRGRYEELAEAVSAVVDAAYDQALAKVEKTISEGGYDYGESMDALINHAQGSAGYDVCYILAAYSASMQQNVSQEDMIAKLEGVSGEMFPVTQTEKEFTRQTPVAYDTYKAKKVRIVTSSKKIGTMDGKPVYQYSLEEKTYYVKDRPLTSDKEITVAAYEEITVKVPVYGGGEITGTKKETYYQKKGTKTLKPKKETVKYLECTIQSFDDSVIAAAFGIDLNKEYDEFGVTYREAIENMAKALKMALYGSMGSGENVSLTDKELVDFVNGQNCNDTRKHILSTALSLVGKVPYFWGGKSGPGWNDEWNTPKLVTAAGSSSTGTIRPYGLDCSGFTAWTYSTALGVDIGAGTSGQYPKTSAVTKEELLPGDLGFLASSGGKEWSHVLMFAGYDQNGMGMWVHCTSGKGVVINTPSYADSLVLRRPTGVDYDAAASSDASYGEPLYTIEVDVTHYCNCKKCCGKWAGGNMASGKKPATGMVAMSSHYPFGTQIMIKGTMYTVEDRGGTGIENDIHRVDIFVPDHKQALRMGRYKTTAKIYRLGR